MTWLALPFGLGKLLGGVTLSPYPKQYYLQTETRPGNSFKCLTLLTEHREGKNRFSNN